MLLAVTVGNTRLRYGLFEGVSLMGHGAVPTGPSDPPLAAGWMPIGRGIEAAAIASVNPRRSEEAIAALRKAGHRILIAGPDLPIPIENRYRPPSEVGVDRLLNGVAASRLWPGRGTVVLDFGTALSVSIVSPTGEFLGGPIAPGAPSAAAGLAARTAKLPEVRLERPCPRFLTASTRDAIEAGIFWSVAGGAARILDGLNAELPFQFHTVATGGDASLFAPAIPRVEIVDGELTLKGLAACFEEMRLRS